MARYGVYGSHGFIGRHLVKRLLAKGHKVVRLDREANGKLEALDCVIDLAAYGNLASQPKDAEKTYEANLMRVVRSMDYLDKNTRYIYISTSSVTRPVQNYYSQSKKAAEEYLKVEAQNGLKTAIVRPYSITGPGDQEEHLIPRLINSCFTKEKMKLVTWPVHDYIDVDDLVDAILLVDKKGQFKGEIYEVGKGKQHTNQEIREVVESTLKEKANLDIVDDARRYDSDEWRANPERIASLGWEPKYSLEEIVKRMAADYFPGV